MAIQRLPSDKAQNLVDEFHKATREAHAAKTGTDEHIDLVNKLVELKYQLFDYIAGLEEAARRIIPERAD